jgi:hypothetical protein
MPTIALPVAGKTAVIIPVLAVLLAGVAVPATVKKLAPTPCRVWPCNAVRVMVAVYCVVAWKVL